MISSADATTPADVSKETLLNSLLIFVNQRSGIDWRNYYTDWRDDEGRRAYRSEYRSILREGKEARELLRFIRHTSITAEEILSFDPAGRLTFDHAAGRWDYCTGQYFPTEYRAAACRFLAAVIRHYFRKHCNCPAYEEQIAAARRAFGPAIVGRWF